MNIAGVIAQELDIKEKQALSAIELIDEGCSIPFIARYRKEVTGSLNDEVLRALNERLAYLRSLEEKKELVLRVIEEQGKLTPELRKQIEDASTLVAVEDLYRPYRPKRRTRATIAKEKGLEGLANLIFLQDPKTDPEKEAALYINPDTGVANTQEALAGASDILAEFVGDDADCRTRIRELTARKGIIISAAKDPEKTSVYEQYYRFEEPVAKIARHRILALNRGEKEKILTVKIETPEEEILSYLARKYVRNGNQKTEAFLKDMLKDSYERLIAPAIEREIRSSLTESAQEGALKVFGKNLSQLLMQPPIAGKTVLGWDPAFRTGCKLAVVDPTGKVLKTDVVYPTQPTTQAKIAAAKKTVSDMIDRYHIDLISLGNGTASRESEAVIAQMLEETGKNVRYCIVNEAGASVYSASELGTKEFPKLDVGGRSAASIARRLQDPLAELVKIDPSAIGVGQYQHDMNQKALKESLTGVVEDCVNRVGVDLNTASAPLLSYISGISASVAQNIVTYREENGAFTERKQLLKVPKLGPKAYEQAAGFLRIRDGKEVLDNTGVHPETYKAAYELMDLLKVDPQDLRKGGIAPKKLSEKEKGILAGKLGIGTITLEDLLKELSSPGRDPRSQVPGPILRNDVLEMKDLKEGMQLKGTVRNITDFGAFVDIGVHQDGLVHISQMSDTRYVKHPMDVVSVGDIVTVKVLSVDEKRGRISLTMKMK